MVEHAINNFYCTLYPDNNFLTTRALDNVEYLLQLDVKPICDNINEFNNKNKDCFGLVLFIMGCSKFQLEGLNSQSFQNKLVLLQLLL